MQKQANYNNLVIDAELNCFASYIRAIFIKRMQQYLFCRRYLVCNLNNFYNYKRSISLFVYLLFVANIDLSRISQLTR